ncbi:MAG: type II secretion system protein GspE, partial [Tepidanaerobacteraceae bacterium]
MKSLEDYLIKENYLTKNDLEKIKEIQVKTDKRLDEVLIDEGFITETKMAEILAITAGVPSVNLNKLYISPDVIRLVPEYLARKHLALPIKKDGNT